MNVKWSELTELMDRTYTLLTRSEGDKKYENVAKIAILCKLYRLEAQWHTFSSYARTNIDKLPPYLKQFFGGEDGDDKSDEEFLWKQLAIKVLGGKSGLRDRAKLWLIKNDRTRLSKREKLLLKLIEEHDTGDTSITRLAEELGLWSSTTT